MAFPCGDCGGNCITDVICCDNCENWFHYKCQNLLKKHITEIRSKKNSFCDYICTSCTKNAAGNFDFEKSIKRLENYSTFGHLEAGARMERILLRHTDSKQQQLWQENLDKKRRIKSTKTVTNKRQKHE